VGQANLVLDADAADGINPLANLSAAVRVGNTLLLGGDEGACLDRLTYNGSTWTGHQRLPLSDCLDLDGAREADIEGLAEDDGWLWVLGSHARTRPRISKGKRNEIDLGSFSDLRDTRPRCLLARLPLVAAPLNKGICLPVRRDGKRHAGLVKQTKHGNALAKLLGSDPLLKPFTRIPAKEGGVDLEGIAVAGTRVAIGMRGPVLQTYAVLLELQVTASRKSGRLKIGKSVCRRLLDLEGLGIRDLKRVGDDLVILAGPTTGLDGPCAVYRWPGWLSKPARQDAVVCLHHPDRIIDLPFGRGEDHPEGLALMHNRNGEAQLLVVCDTPSRFRVDPKRRSPACDIFALSG
jgi:hypothetical protein